MFRRNNLGNKGKQTMIRAKFRNLATLVGLSLFAPSLTLASETCMLEFDFHAVNNIGTITTGDALKGKISFTVDRYWQQGSETRSYFTNGLMTLSDAQLGQVTGAVDIVSVVRAPHTWDYISMVANDVKGNLGGETRYYDPMIFTLADAPNTLTSFDLPKSTDHWNLLTKTQKFQFHTPDANQIFYGNVSTLRGECSS
jgi:hypothetical protein